MQAYIVRRFLLFLPTAFIASIIVFLVATIAPGDVVTLIVYEDASLPTTEAERLIGKLRQEKGLDRPIYQQYWNWLSGAATGHLGRSLYENRLVFDIVKERLPRTMELTLWVFALTFFWTIPLGMIAAIKADTWVDKGIQVFSVLGLSVPTFWSATLLLFVMSRYAGWVPLGWTGILEDPGVHFRVIVFPVLLLSYFIGAPIVRITRSQMMEVLREDYIRTAHAKGLKPLAVHGRHAFRNALIPVLTLGGWYLGRLAGGAVIIEVIFSLPGAGQALVIAVIREDYTVVLALMLITVIFVMALNLLIDVVYAWIDPRIRYA